MESKFPCLWYLLSPGTSCRPGLGSLRIIVLVLAIYYIMLPMCIGLYGVARTKHTVMLHQSIFFSTIIISIIWSMRKLGLLSNYNPNSNTNS
jgi:hypothetical protein